MADFTIEAGVIVSMNRTKHELINRDVYIVGILHDTHIIYINFDYFVIEPTYVDKPQFEVGNTVNIGVDIHFSNSTNANAKMDGSYIEKCSVEKCPWLNSTKPIFTLRDIGMIKSGIDNYFRIDKISRLFNMPVQEVNTVIRKICKELLDAKSLPRLSDLVHCKRERLKCYTNIYLNRVFPKEAQIINSLKDKPEVLNAYYKSL